MFYWLQQRKVPRCVTTKWEQDKEGMGRGVKDKGHKRRNGVLSFVPQVIFFIHDTLVVNLD